ncbi:hypothetical protein HGRIS_005045 [Hohenbuehelia grisea]|uniref:F-box domain-containing protein n=1 Tax=Hohenbuehelia grisea TaxID=104357 RepID=A0ABR3JE88_9AGAR
MEIFLIVAANFRPGLAKATGLSSMMAPSQVCHHWRLVALACAELWSRVHLSHRRLTQLFMSRVGEAGLRVHVHPKHAKRAAPTFLRYHSQRIESLYISLPLPQLQAHFTRRIIDISFENLHTLTLRTMGTHAASILLAEAPFVKYAEDGTPSCPLRRLSLYGAAFRWDSPMYTSLTYLTISRSTFDPSLSISEIVSLLGRIVNLQSFTLLQCRLSGPTIDLGVQPLVLSKLHSLTVHAWDDQGWSRDLFQCLSLPSLRTLDCDSSILSAPATVRVVQGLTKWPHSASLQITSEHLGHFCARFLATNGNSLRISFRDSPSVYSLDQSFIYQTITCIAPIIDTSHITSLRFGGNIFSASATKLAFAKQYTGITTICLHHLKRAETLTLQGDAALVTIDALFVHTMRCVGVCSFPKAHGMDEYGQQTRLLPALQVIRLGNIDFDCAGQYARCHHEHEHGPLIGPSLMDLLVAFVWMRKRLGIPITHISITRCNNVHDDEIDLLSKAVRVIWDGEGASHRGDAGKMSLSPFDFALDVFARHVNLTTSDPFM